MPVKYSVCRARVGTVPLCDNHCCPECGAKLVLRETPNENYWSHELPLPKRICEGCGNEFMPRLCAPHARTCSRGCHERRVHKNYYRANREELNRASSEAYFDKKAKLAKAAENERIFARLRSMLPASQTFGIALLIDRTLSTEEARQLASVGIGSVSARQAVRVREAIGIPAPKGRPSQKRRPSQKP